jgi:predicted  nucleic acid-binding Zn-ribbon protein
MARRTSPQSPGLKPAREKAAAPDLNSRIAALERERASLETDLSAARARIADLESRQAEIADRIAWVLDSLHDLADGAK